MNQPIVFMPRHANNDLFSPDNYEVSTNAEVDAMLKENAVVAIGVSGGKDSQAAAIRLIQYLDEIGHSGPRVAIHADLGSVEWVESFPVCERLCKRLGIELIVVKRAAGGLMERWETRWKNNLARYESLECVKLILPWSTPTLRFCTSETKTATICAELTKRYPGQKILSVTGVRHAESSARARMPISSPQPKLSARKCLGINWNPIITWSTPAVYRYLEMVNEPLHEAYTTYGASRVSCTFCIMGSIGDLMASASCADNAPIYRRMVDLEIQSTFAFQGSRWLGDVAPHLLTPEQVDGLKDAKRRAAIRQEAEALLPAHLMYKKGWPEAVPTISEAMLIASVRQAVAEAVGIKADYLEPTAIIQRYIQLMDTKKSA